MFIFAIFPANIQHWAYTEPLRLLVLAPVLALVWWGLYEKRAGQLEIERRIIFDDVMQSDFELLDLNA